jgi:hypothetical protein
LCADFAADGCQVIAQPCPSARTGPIACIAGRCQYDLGDEARVDVDGAPDGSIAESCGRCLEQELTWNLARARTTYTVSGCEDIRVHDIEAGDCTGTYARCGDAERVNVADLRGALADPDVVAALAAGSVGGAPAPGGFALVVSYGADSFTVHDCSSGATCLPIPPGVTRLRALLQRIENKQACELGSCRPNARFVSQACLACGPGDGCTEPVTLGCVLVCDSAAACPDRPGGATCSTRGLCEVEQCL